VPVGGVVRDTTGAPVAFATVALTRGPVPLPDIAALTDAHGSFVLSVPQPGAYEITAVSAAGRATAAIEVPPDGVPRLELRIDS
jgi:hypothetical protein